MNNLPIKVLCIFGLFAFCTQYADFKSSLIVITTFTFGTFYVDCFFERKLIDKIKEKYTSTEVIKNRAEAYLLYKNGEKDTLYRTMMKIVDE